MFPTDDCQSQIQYRTTQKLLLQNVDIIVVVEVFFVVVTVVVVSVAVADLSCNTKITPLSYFTRYHTNAITITHYY